MISSIAVVSSSLSSSLSTRVSPSTEVHSTDEIDVTLYVSLGVSGAVVVIIVTAAIVIICLRMRLYERKLDGFKSEHIYDYISTTYGNEAYATTANPAYGMVRISGKFIVTTSPNEAYVTSDNIPVTSV